jgi:hypothetical protein
MKNAIYFRFEIGAIVENTLRERGEVAIRTHLGEKKEYYVRFSNGMGNWFLEHQLHEVQVIEHK